MPPELQSGSPGDWLRRARSDLAIACGRLRKGILAEDLCFHAQQAVEKSLKTARHIAAEVLAWAENTIRT